MAMLALVSPGGSPGVTTAALALTLDWPSRVILAECDPSGGDVLAGLLGGHLPASAGLLPLALEAGAGTEVPGDTLWRQLIELDTEHSRLLLAGISDPRQSAALQSSLPWIAGALQGAAADVIADCGRLDAVAAVRPVLSAASLAVLVLRPTLRQLSRAVPRAEMLTSLVGRERVVALLAGSGGASDREASRALGVPVAGHLADDPRTAAVLSDGAGSRSRLQARPLLRSAAAAGRALREAAAAAGPLPGGGDVFSPYDDAPQDQEHLPGQHLAGQYLPARPPRPAGQPELAGREPAWPAPGWPEDDWPHGRRPGSSWPGRHAAGRADGTDAGRDTPARYLSAFSDQSVGSPNGSLVPGGSANGGPVPGGSANGGPVPGSSGHGSTPDGRAPHDGPGASATGAADD
ncbi:MAG TPA: hypothetical protein VFV41_13020 [Streptosporangiaceae bacterium]|nr:hypothetical protein [Streptosporangiaceae bacterium]